MIARAHMRKLGREVIANKLLVRLDDSVLNIRVSGNRLSI